MPEWRLLPLQWLPADGNTGEMGFTHCGGRPQQVGSSFYHCAAQPRLCFWRKSRELKVFRSWTTWKMNQFQLPVWRRGQKSILPLRKPAPSRLRGANKRQRLLVHFSFTPSHHPLLLHPSFHFCFCPFLIVSSSSPDIILPSDSRSPPPASPPPSLPPVLLFLHPVNPHPLFNPLLDGAVAKIQVLYYWVRVVIVLCCVIEDKLTFQVHVEGQWHTEVSELPAALWRCSIQSVLSVASMSCYVHSMFMNTQCSQAPGSAPTVLF